MQKPQCQEMSWGSVWGRGRAGGERMDIRMGEKVHATGRSTTRVLEACRCRLREDACQFLPSLRRWWCSGHGQINVNASLKLQSYQTSPSQWQGQGSSPHPSPRIQERRGPLLGQVPLGCVGCGACRVGLTHLPQIQPGQNQWQGLLSPGQASDLLWSAFGCSGAFSGVVALVCLL